MGSMTFKEALQVATFAPNRALPTGVDQIDLGIFHHEAAQLMRKTVEDHPHRRSFSRLVYVGADRSVRLSNDSYPSGQEAKFDLGIKTQDQRTPKEERQRYFIGALLKSNSVLRPYPLQDLFKLMAPDDDTEARTAVFTADPVNISVVFRSAETPVLPKEFIDERSEIVLNTVDRMVRRFNMDALKETKFVGDTVALMWQKGKFRVFSCASHESIARLQ